ncbi:serine/threonine protein kinase, partial [Streptomyces sp. T-3]|nr:serine/threonine protein kinase [Streptomyces sp. T-3]
PAFDTNGWHDQQHTPPYGPPPQPRRSGRATALLLVVAVLVAIGAGGSVYAVMKGDEGKKGGRGDNAKPPATSSAPVDPPTSAPDTSQPPTSSEPPSSSPAGEDAIPQDFLGTWRATFQAKGTNTRVMTITQGAEGETVMSLVGNGPTHDCRWTAPLRSAGSSDLVLGPSTVTQGDPEHCKPGPVSRLTMPDDGTLVRELIGSGGEPLRYSKS